MCNRYNTPRENEIERMWRVGSQNPPRWWKPHVTPLAVGPYAKPGGELEVGQWGMIPRSSPTRRPTTRDGTPMSTNNARRETLAKSWTFAPAWRAGQRCLIPVTSWVEPYWGLGSRNVWWSFRRADGQPAALAGLYSEWTDPETGELVPNYTMITQPADGHPVLSLMHRPGKEKRGVVMLEPGDWDAWLHGTPDQADALIKLPSLGVLRSGAEKPEEEALLPAEQLAKLNAEG
ncbi:SOS response-associated peptidase [Delftia tsuruhatensis]|uniref:SOS response-associated peptidase n=1 Tax=Delftia tsuruhatensis TaxID=180282 RepID=UPI0031DB6FB1